MRDHHNRREMHFPSDQPLPERRASHRQRVVWDGADAGAATQDAARMCTHWPAGGVERIRTTGRHLHVLAEGLARDGLLEAPAPRHSGCLDLEMPGSHPDGDICTQRMAALSVQVRAQKLALRILADDFATISAWLANAAGSSWEAASSMRQHSGPLVAMGESQRLISKDSLSADINALVATMLRRAAKSLDRLDPAAGAVAADLQGRRTFARVLLRVAELLDNAATMADDATSFVAEFDRRWRLIRHQVALTVSRSAILDASLQTSL